MSWLGGNNQSIGHKQELVKLHLQDRPSIVVGWPWQCRCGSTEYQKYRGRFYCWHCGARIIHPDMKVHSNHPTFRETFDMMCVK